MPLTTANGVDLYYEVRGSGPPVLLIMGSTGDGGHFDALADLLADEFTVITYELAPIATMSSSICASKSSSRDRSVIQFR
jgi:hypothetical protein